MTQEEYKEEARRLRPQLLQTARRYLTEDDAEDTVQDVLLRLWQMVDTLRMPIDALATVLVRNFCVDKLRRQRPSQTLTASYEQPDETETDERIERVLAMIRTAHDAADHPPASAYRRDGDEGDSRTDREQRGGHTQDAEPCPTNIETTIRETI